VPGGIAKAHGFSIWKLIKYIKEELLIVLGTSSSESLLPRMMARLEHPGVRKSTVGRVVPTGDPFKLDGPSIHLTMAAASSCRRRRWRRCARCRWPAWR
jgi:aerobic C4-dicarboxylate transport protein